MTEINATPSSRRRVLAAAEHRTTDRVAITFDAEKEVYDDLNRRLGTTGKPDLFDALGVDTCYLGPRILPSAEARECPEGESPSMWGYRTKIVHYEGGSYGELCYSPLADRDDPDDIDAHPWPSADRLDYSGAAEAIAPFGERAVVGTFGWGAYFRATYLRGMENLMLDFALRPAYAERLIATVAEVTLGMLDKLLAEAGDLIDIVYMADDYCSQLGPLFSPGVFKRVVMPYLSAAVDRAHRHNKKFLLHCCGAVRPLLPMIIEAGVDMLEPIQIRAEGMDPAGLKRDFGRDLCFWGGVDLQEVLCRRTPVQVADEVRRLIDILGDGGGYVLGPGHTYIQPDAPTDNVLAMYEAARTYAR